MTPNRRGVKSRELVLDAAERVMATEGFEAATIARVVDEAGVPLSSVYHYYGSKDGVLLAVMQRGADRFHADVPDYDQRSGTAVEHLRLVIFDAIGALERHPNFLRLVIAFAVQPPQAGDGEISDVVRHVRQLALKRLRRQIAIACDDDARSRAVDRVAARAGGDRRRLRRRQRRSVDHPRPDPRAASRRPRCRPAHTQRRGRT